MKVTDGRRVLPPVPKELEGTWEGAEWEYLRWSAAMTFRERMMWLEEASEFAAALQSAKRIKMSDENEEA